MKFIKFTALLVFCMGLQFCKKTADPGDPMPIASSKVSVPPGYDANQFHNRREICEINDQISQIYDLVVDSTDNSKAFLLGGFAFSEQYFGLNAPSIVGFNAVNNSFFAYSPCINPSQGGNIYSLLQSSNGDHYLGGHYSPANSISGIKIGRKTPNGTSFTSTVNVNSTVKVVKEIGSNIYFTGDFDKLNNISCAPILYYNTLTNGPVSEFGQVNPCRVRRMEFYNSNFFITSQDLNGYISMSNGGSWAMPAGGFNNYVQDLLLANGKLYAGGNMTMNYNNTVSLHYVNQFDGVSWVKTGINNLPGPCLDLEFHNGMLYASGNYIYYLDPSDNKWKNACQNISIEPYNAYIIEFINGKLYGIDNKFTYKHLFELTK